MNRKKKRKKGFYKIVAKAIVEGSPFDVSKNGEGWKKVQELVTLYMLRDLSEASKYGIWNDYLTRVDGVFNKAISYINENPDNLPQYRNIHVHVHRPENKRNNEFLSIRIGYRKARERNTDRLIRRIGTVVRPAIREIRKTQPERITELGQVTHKLLLGGNNVDVHTK